MSDRLEEIRARAEAATEGPWETDASGWVFRTEDSRRYAVAQLPLLSAPTDAEFIAHARTDVPQLLAWLDEARERDQKMHEWIAGIPDRIEENEFLDERAKDFATGVVEGILGLWFDDGPLARFDTGKENER